MTMKAPSRRPSRKKKQEAPKEPVQEQVVEEQGPPEPPKEEVKEDSALEKPKAKKTRKPRKTKQQKIEEEIANAKLEYQGPPYILHEIECLCFSRTQRAMAHDAHGRRIEAFSLVDEDGELIPSVVQCEDCGRKWEINGLDDYDLSQMDRMPTYTRKRLQRVLPSDLVHLCNEWKVPTALMAQIQWIIEEEKWGTQILISKKKYRREDISFDARILIINGPINFKVKEIKASNVAEFW